MNWYIEVLKKYAVFQGRARRKEYWMFTLFNVLIAMGLAFIDVFAGLANEDGVGALSTIYSLAVLLPGLGVAVRRLHDIGRSGWWLLIALVPVVGAVVLIVFAVLDSEPGSNEYGPNPKAIIN